MVFPNAERWMRCFTEELERRVHGEARFDAFRRASSALARDLAAARAELMVQQQLVHSCPALAAYERQVNARWVDVVETSLRGAEEPLAVSRPRLRIVSEAIAAALIATIQQWFLAGGRSDLDHEGQQTLDMLEQGLVRTLPELIGKERQTAR